MHAVDWIGQPRLTQDFVVSHVSIAPFDSVTQPSNFMYNGAGASDICGRAKRQEVVMSSELAGKVAIVTGGASGIGRAGVAALLGAGAAVAALDRDEGGVNAVVSDEKKSGGKAIALVADLADTKRIPEAVAK